jgi:hypothetical protein
MLITRRMRTSGSAADGVSLGSTLKGTSRDLGKDLAVWSQQNEYPCTLLWTMTRLDE